MKCYNCGIDGHMAAYCPLLTRAHDQDEHQARIDSFVDRWVAGEISTEVKRRQIGAENILWYGERCPVKLMYP